MTYVIDICCSTFSTDIKYSDSDSTLLSLCRVQSTETTKCSWRSSDLVRYKVLTRSHIIVVARAGSCVSVAFENSLTASNERPEKTAAIEA